MSDLERTINRELRRGRLPVHVRRRHARRLAAAIEAEGYGVSQARLAETSAPSTAGLAGERFGAGLAAALRQAEQFSKGIARGMAVRDVARLGRRP